MPRSGLRLSRPVYEGLPWVYVVCGLAALVGSYVSPYRVLGLILGVAGLLGLLAGIVVLLRRRDYREMRSQYEKLNEGPVFRKRSKARDGDL